MKIETALGICIGASTVSAVSISREEKQIKIGSVKSIVHNGNPAIIIEEIFNQQVPANIAITGKKFRKFLNLTSISEAEAVETAAAHLKLSSDLIISAGGENFIVYQLDKNNRISKVFTGNKCASGTGEFFLQQVKRMDLPVEKAVNYGAQGEPYNISGRCSVFCKSDCTHALNKGVAKKDVVAGLSKMMAQKIIELTSRVPHDKAVIIGGTAKNAGMLRFLNEHFNEILVPVEAPYFEALGAALFAINNITADFNINDLFRKEHSTFPFHKPLNDFTQAVKFEIMERGSVLPGDECILGLDVGSTTTKAVLLRQRDDLILASEYLRTNGDPVTASIECYKSINAQIGSDIRITGLGVTGSGRHIAGLHALTEGIINEIIAHAAATIFFDKDVDTIFEIGGQDAKYTFITAGVPSDYAMNEACSAGTGSFLEEAARESLDVNYTDIGTIAMRATAPPNFNDQCAAFISSDIKNALHEGLSKEDIVAGLVYSVCMNYNNRVKGNRPVGRKVFMQGGVCYNKAVPVAMAALTGKQIIVPPEPGLMGAFGVALEIKKRQELNLIDKQEFFLEKLIRRKVEYAMPFICPGGVEKCDRKCSISIIKLEGKKYPFGGACNKYYDLQYEKKKQGTDYVKIRESLVYEKYIHPLTALENAPVIGISKSFMTNTLFPLYYNFFTQLGFKVFLPEESLTAGIDKKEAAFCYPVELAHGYFQSLIDMKPDYIFMPHITEFYNPNEKMPKRACVLLQSENYYLKAAFKDNLTGIKMLTPVIDFSAGYESRKDTFIELARQLGKSKAAAIAAFDFSAGELGKMFAEFKQLGREALEQLEQNPEHFGVVLFGRAYNAFSKEANLGIPQKFASRGITVIPHDFLPFEQEESYNHMYWAMGQQILKGARFVKSHENLFAAFITNFSCGPDSFIIPYFRTIMGRKPSLTLELDSHSADAGINTRIEAALDIIKRYRELERQGRVIEEQNEFVPMQVRSETHIIDSFGAEFKITDPSIKVVVPSMGSLATEAFSAAFRYMGINSEPLPIYNNETLGLGRGNTTCKECLPLILNSGSMIEYYEKRTNPDEKTLFFMAKGDGPCRLGQYFIYMEEIIKKRKMKNFAVYTLSDEDSYEGLGNKFVLRGWAAITLADVMKDIYSAIRALAVDKHFATKLFRTEYNKILHVLETSSLKDVFRQLEDSALKLGTIKTKYSLKEAKKIMLIGEIFVRHDEFSRMDLTDYLAENEFVVKVVPIGEYVYYSNHLAAKDNKSVKSWLKFRIRDRLQKSVESRIKKALSLSGFVEYDMEEITKIIELAEKFIDPALAGEAVLTVGSAFREIIDHTCGVISLGPFGCMPSRVAESILNVEMNLAGKLKAEGKNDLVVATESLDLPYLAIETDGNIFPQIIQSKIEIFMLQASRLHEKLTEAEAEAKETIRSQSGRKLLKIFKKNILTAKGETVPQYD